MLRRGLTRLASKAAPAGHTAALATDLEGVLYESRGRQVLRNVAEPVEIFAAVRVDENADHPAIDAVCQMAVDPEHAVGRLLVDEKAHYFWKDGRDSRPYLQVRWSVLRC